MVRCLNCDGKGVWNGIFHSGVCAVCGGFGRLSIDGEKIPNMEAIAILRAEHRSLFDEIQHVVGSFGSNIELPEITNQNQTESSNKTAPYQWVPTHLIICSDCKGSGTYSGITLKHVCRRCDGIGIVPACDSVVAIDEVIASLSLINQRLKQFANDLFCNTKTRDAVKQFRSEHCKTTNSINSAFD